MMQQIAAEPPGSKVTILCRAHRLFADQRKYEYGAGEEEARQRHAFAGKARYFSG